MRQASRNEDGSRGPAEGQGVVPAGCNQPGHELQAGGQLVLQPAGSAKSAKTMNTEIQRGLVQSAASLAPNCPLQDKIDDHF